jgi:hypothetical protein
MIKVEGAIVGVGHVGRGADAGGLPMLTAVRGLYAVRSEDTKTYGAGSCAAKKSCPFDANGSCPNRAEESGSAVVTVFNSGGIMVRLFCVIERRLVVLTAAGAGWRSVSTMLGDLKALNRHENGFGRFR